MIVAAKTQAEADRRRRPAPKKLATPPKVPVPTKADLDVNKRRDRQENFVGYLQQCLEKSGI